MTFATLYSTNIYCTLYVCILVTQYIAPGPVRELSYEVITNTSVNITWKSPEETDGGIVSYSVEHGEYQKGPTTSVTILAGGPMYTVIRALGK